MKSRLILVGLGLFALTILSVGIEAQQPAPNPTQEKDDIITSEQQLARQFGEFQDALLRLKQKMARGTPEERKRAEVLDKVLDLCKELAVQQEFTKMIEILRLANVNKTDDLTRLQEQSDTLGGKLRRILDMLQDTKGNQLNKEINDLKKIIDDIQKAINIQRQIELQTEQKKTDNAELAKLQEGANKKTEKIDKDIGKYLDKDNKDGKGGENLKGENKDAKGDGAKGEAKDAGKQKTGEATKGEAKDAGKDSKGAKGETKPGEKKGDPSKTGDQEPKANAKSGEKGKEGAPDPSAKKSDDKSGKGQEGAAKENKGDKSPDKKGQEGSAKDSGEKKGDPMSKDGPKGSAKSGDDKKPSDPKSGAPDSQAKAGGGDPMAGGAKPKAGDPKDVQGGDAKGGDAKGGDAKGGDAQGAAKSGDSKDGQGSAKDGGGSPSPGNPMPQPPQSAQKGDNSPPPPPSNPNNKQNDDVVKSQKKIQEAGYDQQSATDEIKKKDNVAAAKKQADAIQKMEDAKKKLEKLLQQMREEEIERVLAALQARCEKMLMMQQQVLAGTIDTDKAIQKNADKKPNQFNKRDALKLSDQEKDIVQEANKCIDILEAEGSAVAFPEVFQQIRQDMIHVQKRLELTDTADLTQGIERDIIDTLKEMIESLKKARQDNQQGDAKPGQPGQAGKPGDQKLLELIQELKMVRSLQKRINDRTADRAKRFPGEEQARDPQIVRELRGLADRQQRIQEIVSRIAKGDNK